MRSRHDKFHTASWKWRGGRHWATTRPQWRLINISECPGARPISSFWIECSPLFEQELGIRGKSKGWTCDNELCHLANITNAMSPQRRSFWDTMTHRQYSRLAKKWKRKYILPIFSTTPLITWTRLGGTLPRGRAGTFERIWFPECWQKN